MSDETAAQAFVDAAQANSGRAVLELPSGPVHGQLRPGGPEARLLLVTFHGAVNRETREVPVFQPALPLGFPAHQVSLADPCMDISGPHSLGWYAGTDAFALQAELPQALAALQRALGAEKLVLTGSSGGGFASLFYSWHIPGSFALAVAPQTNMHRYYPRHIQQYCQGCWPRLSGPEELSQHITTSVCDLYAEKIPNTVIYVQSAGDRFHLVNHMMPFVSAISGHTAPAFVPHVDYWGVPDHSRAVPASVVADWTRAIALAEDAEPKTLLAAFDAARATQPAAPAVAPKAAKPGTGPDPDQMRIADRLKDYHLRNAKGA